MGTLTKKKLLTPKQMKALVALTAGMTQKKAAELAGVSEATINNWLRLNAFHKEFRKAMERMRYEFEARTISAGLDGVAVIHKELNHADVEVRLKAGTALANNAVRVGSRYKELEVSGALPAAQPLVVFPDGTQMPWNAKPVSVIVDVKARELPEKSGDNEDNNDD